MKEFRSTYKGKYEVIVVGGGVSGSHAAIAAGRSGVKTLLIEQFGFLGGSLTAMGVGPMMSFHNRSGRQLVFGSPQEMIDRLVASGASPGHIIDGTGYCSTVTPFDAEALKMELDKMVSEAGVDVLFHTRLLDLKMEGDRIRSVYLHNREGILEYEADIFIDASGDGELVKNTAVPFVLGREEDNKTQPLTMNAKIGNVDRERFIRYIKENWEQFDDKVRRSEKEALLDRIPRISLWGFYKLWEEAKEKGEVSVPRDNVLFFETNTPGEFIFNTSRVLDVNVFDGLEMSKAERTGRQQAKEIYDFAVKYIPGFENAKLLTTAPHIGIRETRHPLARYVLKAEDLVKERRFENPVAVGGYPIDIHSPDGQTTHSVHLRDEGMYYVPVDVLLTNEVSNLILSGRAIGADHYASAAIRVTPIAMAIGQGAGTLAAVSVKSNCKPAELEYEVLKNALIKSGVYLGEIE